MADERQGLQPDVAGAVPGEAAAAVRPTTADPGRQLPAEAETAAGVPDYEDPELARAEIEATRNRMSGTIDEIEDVLVRKKERIQQRLDVLAPVRENPWQSMGIALGAGVLFGLLTGGDEERARAEPAHDWERRAAVLEARTRRLLAIAREQEDELRSLRRKQEKKLRRRRLRERVQARLGEVEDELAERAEGIRSGLDDLRESVARGVSHFLSESLRRLGARG